MFTHSFERQASNLFFTYIIYLKKSKMLIKYFKIKKVIKRNKINKNTHANQ